MRTYGRISFDTAVQYAPGALPLRGQRVDVPGVEAAAEDLGELRREAAERRIDDLDRLGPRERARLADRRVLVGELQRSSPSRRAFASNHLRPMP